METPSKESNAKYIKEFKGGSMAKTFLIEKKGSLFVRKEVVDTSGLGLNKLEKQADWILDLESEVSKIFPKIEEKHFGGNFGYYDMSYHHMPSFRDYLINAGVVDENIKNLLKQIIAFSSKISSKEEDSNKNKTFYVRDLHFDKMHQRCSMVANKDKVFNLFFEAPYLNINNEKYLNLREIINKISQDTELMYLLLPKKWYRSHGDFTFQNILTNGEDFKIIDPRGEGEDTIYYDISKLFQSCSGKYDLFTEDNYDVIYTLKNYHINYKIKKHADLFDEVFEIIKEEIPKFFDLEEEWEIIASFYEASHFISMTPFRYEENLPFTIACYAIGIQKLNEVYSRWQDMKKNEGN